MDGARVTPRKDANGNVPLKQRDEQLVLPMRSLGEGIFIHSNQVVITFSVISNVPLLLSSSFTPSFYFPPMVHIF